VFGVEEGGSSALVLGDAVPAAGREGLRVLVPACAGVDVLRFDGHGAVDDWQFAAHGEGGGAAQLQVVVLVSVVLVGPWHFQGVQRDMSLVGKVLYKGESTYLLR
jgi:hypothetical protein